ncbi:MAG: flagellar motor switch protein FliN [Ilumatobacteraceae bacterium]
MTETSIPKATLTAAVEAAALVLAEQLGLGSEARSNDDWPIDEGDQVLRMVFTGGEVGMLVLAVNDDVADRLQSNQTLLDRAFTDAIASIASIVGLELTGDVVRRETIPPPATTAMILDEGSLTALAAIVIGADVSAASTPGANAPVAEAIAPVYEPESVDAVAGFSMPGSSSAMSVLHDVQLLVTAELGRTTMPVRDVLALAPGMVVEIDRIAGSPIDLLVNGRRIAAGEVVVIDEEFGIRITEIIAAGDQR